MVDGIISVRISHSISDNSISDSSSIDSISDRISDDNISDCISINNISGSITKDSDRPMCQYMSCPFSLSLSLSLFSSSLSQNISEALSQLSSMGNCSSSDSKSKHPVLTSNQSPAASSGSHGPPNHRAELAKGRPHTATALHYCTRLAQFCDTII